MSYAALWCKSNFSFLQGASFPDELVETAVAAGLAAIALTDCNGLYGMVRAHAAAKKRGVKLIVGSEISVEDGSRLILLVRNGAGYRRLCSLVTTGRLRAPKGESRLSWTDISADGGGLVAIIPATEHALPWSDLKAAFGAWLYLGYARHRLFEDAEQKKWVETLAEAEGLPVVAAPEVLYHDSSRRPLQDVLTCIRHKRTLEEAGTLLKANHQYGLNSSEEFRDRYADSPQAVRNTLRIAAACEFSLDSIHYTYPTEKLPRGVSVMGRLFQLVERGARKRYPDGVPEAVTRQIGQELRTIGQLEYGGYFLTMWEIVRYCRKQGILCQGRGSAANSIVCYCLDITAIDPVKMDLLFERFLSLERAEPPDIDLDIEHQRREEVIQYMYRKYGRARAAMVANFIRYRPKSAVRDVGKVLGFSSVMLERLARNLDAWWEPFEQGLAEGLVQEEGIVASPAENVDRRELLKSLCKEILGFPRHLSIHPGGFILGSRPIADLVPVENAAMPDRTVIQWDKYDVEEMNLFKVDLLGLGALSHLDHTMKLLKKHRNIDIRLADISRLGDDAEVFDALCRSDSVGVFQVESRAQMAMLPRLKPRRFYDLVIEISLVRPGPISGGMVHPYLRRRSGQEEVVYPHPSLEPVLKKTLGVPLFQEQVMKLAIIAADYSPGEADQLRRDMGAWRSSSRLEGHKERLISRMVKKGITHEFAESVYSQIQGFGEYGFPESHAASFALIAYATAWFKVKYPAFFTCGLLNAWPMGFYSPASVVDDAKRHGIPVLPIDAGISRWECAPEFVHGENRWGVRMGLRYVKGLSRGDGERIEAVAAEIPAGSGRISGVDEFAARSGLGVKTMKALALSGALDSLSGNRRSRLWHSLVSHRYEEQTPDWGYAADAPLSFDALNQAETVDWDYAASQHSTMAHPLESLRTELKKIGLLDSEEVRRRSDGSLCRYAGIAICRQRPATAAGVMFITLEDEFGFVNLVLWRKVYEQYKEIVLTRSFLGVAGKIQAREGTVHLVVDECFVPLAVPDSLEVRSRDFR